MGCCERWSEKDGEYAIFFVLFHLLNSIMSNTITIPSTAASGTPRPMPTFAAVERPEPAGGDAVGRPELCEDDVVGDWLVVREVEGTAVLGVDCGTSVAFTASTRKPLLSKVNPLAPLASFN
jgi:hypothetical protein